MSDDSQPVVRRCLAGALVGTPVVWLAAQAVSPPMEADAARQLAVVAAYPERWTWSMVLVVAGMVTYIPTVLGLLRLIREGSPRLAAVGGSLSIYGAVIGASDGMFELQQREMVAHSADRAQMVALLERTDNAPVAGVVFATAGLSFVIGGVLLGVALARSRSVPTWCGWVFGLGVVINLLGWTANSIPVIAASSLVVPAGAGPAAAALASSRGARERESALV